MVWWMIGDCLGRIDVIFTAVKAGFPKPEISSTMMNVLIENFVGCGMVVVLISGDSLYEYCNV